MAAVESRLGPPNTLAGRGEGPNPIDIHVGSRLRLRRTLLGLSQEKLGEAVGITFQQLQKYERGANRISASRLFNLSQVLEVPVSFFFDDMPTMEAMSIEESSNLANGGTDFEALARRETLELVRAYYRITNSSVRRRAFELLKVLGDEALSVDEGAEFPGT